jgi:hypothetical protein
MPNRKYIGEKEEEKERWGGVRKKEGRESKIIEGKDQKSDERKKICESRERRNNDEGERTKMTKREREEMSTKKGVIHDGERQEGAGGEREKERRDDHLSAEDELEDAYEQDAGDAHGEGEHGGEEEAPPLPVP